MDVLFKNTSRNHLLEPLERTISDVLIPALLEHQVAETECDLLALPVRMGGLGLVNLVSQSQNEYEVSIKATAPLVEQIRDLQIGLRVRD